MGITVEYMNTYAIASRTRGKAIKINTNNLCESYVTKSYTCLQKFWPSPKNLLGYQKQNILLYSRFHFYIIENTSIGYLNYFTTSILICHTLSDQTEPVFLHQHIEARVNGMLVKP